MGEFVAVAKFVGVEVGTTASVTSALDVSERRSVAPQANVNKTITQRGSNRLKRIMGRLYLREYSVSML